MSQKQVAIIGAGHNALVAACYLAKDGFAVSVFEKREIVGGLCVTEELLPGYKISPCASWYGMLQSKIVTELKLKEYGLTTFAADPQLFLPFLDGSFFMSLLDPKKTKTIVKKLSLEDAKAWDRFWDDMMRAIAIIKPFLLKAPVTKNHLESHLIQSGLPTIAAYLFNGSFVTFLKQYFISERILIPFIASSLATRFGSYDAPGALFNYLYMLCAETNAKETAWGFAKGGMGSVTKALAAAAISLGVKIYTNSGVKNIITKNQTASGIMLDDGSKIEADIIISGTTMSNTFTALLAKPLPEMFRKAVNKLDMTGSGATIHIGLSGLPKFIIKALRNYHHSGIIVIAPSLDYIKTAYEDSLVHRFSKQPLLTFSFPSVVDPSLSPPGKHLLSIFCQYVSYRGSTPSDAEKRLFFRQTIQILKKYLPTIEKYIEEYIILFPEEYEVRYFLTKGNHEHLQMKSQQLFEDRPIRGYSTYTTPLKNLYLCGSDTHPGGTVTGACGYNCAQSILKSQKSV